jgi:Transposase DDE domain/Domain of unknown function (DUF4372)
MDKGKTFVGQPILAQIISCIPKNEVEIISKAHNSDRYYKKIPLQTHLVTMLYGVLSCCTGLREICEGMLVCEGKLNHLGLQKAPARSTLSDANNNRHWLAFESIYYMLIKRYHSFLSDSRLKGLRIKNLKIIDSTTLRLFSDLLRGVGRNPVHGRKKGGIKVHTMLDAFTGVASFVRMTEAKVHDRNFLPHLKLEPGSFLVFDKAYNVYRQFAQWTSEEVWFVTRMKKNAAFHVRKVITDNTKKKKAKGVIKEQYITMSYKEDGTAKTLQLRRITFKDKSGHLYFFITNNFKISAEQVALAYKHRWMIEILFKQVKQNFPLNYFWGESENAIRIQVFSVLIAQVLMVVIRKKSETKRSFTSIITVVRLHIMSYVNLFDFLKDTYKAWRSSNSPPLTNKMGIALSINF